MDAEDRASRLVIDRLGALAPAASAQSLLHEVGRNVLAANAELRGAPTAMVCTLVVLLVYGRHFAALRAGDSRLYRLRAGVLEQLTTGHGAVPDVAAAARAVGAADSLVLDVTQGELASGDRFLLCSDGLAKVLPDAEIGRIAEATPLDRLPARLVAALRETGAADRIAVLAVEVAAP